MQLMIIIIITEIMFYLELLVTSSNILSRQTNSPKSPKFFSVHLHNVAAKASAMALGTAMSLGPLVSMEISQQILLSTESRTPVVPRG